MSVSTYTGGDKPALPFEGKSGPSESDVVQSLFSALEPEEENSGDEQEEESTDKVADEEVQETADDEETEDEDLESDEGSEEESEEDADQPSLHKLKANGVEEEVTYEELLRRASAGTDYTKKTQALSAREKELDGEKGQTTKARQEYIDGLKRVEATLEELQPKIDWDKLRRKDPEQFSLEWIAAQERKTALEAVQAKRKQEEAKQDEESNQALLRKRDEEIVKLKEKIPVLNDLKKGPAYFEKLCSFMRDDLGYTDEEIQMTQDHRLFVNAARAMDGTELVKKGKEKLGTKAAAAPKKVLPPGTRAQRGSGVSTITKARQHQRLQKTGRERDALPIVERILG